MAAKATRPRKVSPVSETATMIQLRYFITLPF